MKFQEYNLMVDYKWVSGHPSTKRVKPANYLGVSKAKLDQSPVTALRGLLQTSKEIV